MSTRKKEVATFLASRPTREVSDIKVKITVISRNGLRKFVFELEKTTTGGVVKWTIHFQLFERAKKTDPWGDPVVELNIEVDAKLNAKAQTMADKSMSQNQAAYLIGPGADKSKDKDKAKARKAVQDTLNK